MLILDSIPPIERIKLSAALAKAVTQLRSEDAPLARVRLSRDVAAILAELGAGSAPSLKFSLKDKAASAESIKAYAAQMRLPESLARFERETLGSLAETIGDISLADLVVGSRSPASDENNLAAFDEIASRGVTPPIDRERVLSRIAESEELLKGSVRTDPAVVELDDKITALNSSFTETASRIRAQMREDGADRALLSDKLYDLNVQYKADFEKLKQAHIAAQREFQAEKAAKALELFKEDGEKVINTLMAASPITEQEATAWASQQVVDKKALAKLSRLGYKKDDLFRDMAEFYRLTGGKASAVRISTDGGRRANAVGVEARLDEKVINLGSHFDKTVLFHELAHHLENDPIAKAASNGFLVKRREGKQPYSLRSLTGNRGYHIREVAYKDAFMNPYIGKVYRDGVTEVFSMGVQYLSNPKDAAIFAAKDPEMFAMVTGYLAGNLTPAMNAKLHMHTGVIGTLQEERKVEDEQYQKALTNIAKRIAITKDSWWADISAADRSSDEGETARMVSYAFTSKSNPKYVGSFGEYRIFEGTFRNKNTSRNAKGHVVVKGAAPSVIPDYAVVHGGLDAAKALIAVAESQGLRLSSAWYNTFFERMGRNPKKEIIKTAQAITGEAQ